MLLGCTVLTLTLAAPVMAGESAATMSAKLEQVSQGLAGRIGVAARLIGGDEVVTLNDDEAFVMASTVKIAVAATVLDPVADPGQNFVVIVKDGKIYKNAVK